MEISFVSIVGYVLGILIVCVISGIFLKPIKFVLKLVLNSALALVFMALINLIGSGAGIHIGLNPVTAVIAGALGIPGVILILLLQIFY